MLSCVSAACMQCIEIRDACNLFRYGFHAGFGAAGVGMVLGLAVYIPGTLPMSPPRRFHPNDAVSPRDTCGHDSRP